MLRIGTPAELGEFVGKSLGVSPWINIDQEMINHFAKATGDDQWIHVDVERAKQELPDGKTIAHGYLTLSLLPRMTATLLRFENVAQRLNYGSDKVRFLAPVPSGARLRLALTLLELKEIPLGWRLRFENIVEIHGQERPAVIAETLSLVQPMKALAG